MCRSSLGKLSGSPVAPLCVVYDGSRRRPQISFLDVSISRNPDGSLHHNVYRKPTHTYQVKLTGYIFR